MKLYIYVINILLITVIHIKLLIQLFKNSVDNFNFTFKNFFENKAKK